MNSLETLVQMLSYRRPAGSKTERRFISEYIRPLGVWQDRGGNLLKRIGNAPILWSCHTDTVHRMGGLQPVYVADNEATLPRGTTSNCLGADDTVGVWLLREMILAERPGLYVFHRAEERGGVGSDWLAAHTPQLLQDMECAIALDRRGVSDVITHQAYGRCCSDAFAYSVASQLNAKQSGLRYTPDDTGVFTDTANYVELIGECSNLSVGYWSEHTTKESLDLDHAIALRDALLGFDASKLTFERKAGEIDAADWSGYHRYGDDAADWSSVSYNGTENDMTERRHTIAELVRDHPNEVADILESFGVDWSSLAQEIWDRQSGGSARFKL
jgi:hypothetical protein